MTSLCGALQSACISHFPHTTHLSSCLSPAAGACRTTSCKRGRRCRPWLATPCAASRGGARSWQTPLAWATRPRTCPPLRPKSEAGWLWLSSCRSAEQQSRLQCGHRMSLSAARRLACVDPSASPLPPSPQVRHLQRAAAGRGAAAPAVCAGPGEAAGGVCGRQGVQTVSFARRHRAFTAAAASRPPLPSCLAPTARLPALPPPHANRPSQGEPDADGARAASGGARPGRSVRPRQHLVWPGARALRGAVQDARRRHPRPPAVQVG